jgi:hypothetical protein
MVTEVVIQGWAWVVMFGMFKNNLEKMNIIVSKKLTRCTSRVKGHMSCSFLVFSTTHAQPRSIGWLFLISLLPVIIF